MSEVPLWKVEEAFRVVVEVHAALYLALLGEGEVHKKHPSPYDRSLCIAPYVPRHRATAGSYGGGVLYE